MPLYTVTAFRWSGTGYNSQYNTSYTATFNDDDPAYQGGSDSNETISINGGAFGASVSVPYVINVSFTDTLGNSHVEPFYFFNTGGSWYFTPGPGSAFTVGATLGSYQSHTTGWNYADVACFTRGTLIETENGPVPVETLTQGQMVLTDGNGPQPLRLMLSRKLTRRELRDNPRLLPVRISSGALGKGLPRGDLLVSRQHRMLVSSKISHRMFDTPEALVAAIRLVALPGIYLDDSVDEVEYFHLIFDHHQVIYAQGAPSESFLLAPHALQTQPPEIRTEIETLFPDLTVGEVTQKSACIIPTRPQQRSLVARHAKNAKPILEEFGHDFT